MNLHRFEKQMVKFRTLRCSSKSSEAPETICQCHLRALVRSADVKVTSHTVLSIGSIQKRRFSHDDIAVT